MQASMTMEDTTMAKVSVDRNHLQTLLDNVSLPSLINSDPNLFMAIGALLTALAKPIKIAKNCKWGLFVNYINPAHKTESYEGSFKIHLIKFLREITNCGLKEGKDFADTCGGEFKCAILFHSEGDMLKFKDRFQYTLGEYKFLYEFRHFEQGSKTPIRSDFSKSCNSVPEYWVP